MEALAENVNSALTPTEVMEEDEKELAVTEEQVDCEGILKTPCVVCGIPVAGVKDKYAIFQPVTLEEQEHDKIFQWFLINFRFKPKNKVKKGPWSKVRNKKSEGWD